VDSLATFARQVDVDTAHPECAGYCALRLCADKVPAGGACRTSEACGAGALCVQGKCAPGTAPGAGEPCPAGVCKSDARCLRGRCVAPKEEGEPCEADAACRGACNRGDGGPQGTCGMRCARPGSPRGGSRPLAPPGKARRGPTPREPLEAP
jgi:hypothetical protein